MEKQVIEQTSRHENSNARVLYLIGRSGEGKSSLINGLANMHVAEVGHYKTDTLVSKSYLIELDGGTTWQVYETCGLSETTSDEATRDPLTQIRKEITDRKPDAIVFVVSARGTRNCINEFNTLCQILTEMQQKFGEVPPVVTVVTQADLFGKINEWPPEEYPGKQVQLKTLLDMIADKIMHATEYSPIDPNHQYYGYSLKGDKPMLYVVPVAVPIPEDGDVWNIHTLSLVLGKQLSPEARYQFFHAEAMNDATESSSNHRNPPHSGNGRKKGKKDLIKYFTAAAFAVGILSPFCSEKITLPFIQMVMVSYIAFQSGRARTMRTAIINTAAVGLTFVAGQGCLKAVQELIKLIPVPSWVISGAIFGVGTYGMGKSAKKYLLEG